jgi:hypothetical protein
MPRRFEWLVGEVFRREGCSVQEVGRQDGPDGNIDLALHAAGKRRIVQCKRWTSRRVGVDEIRQFAGSLSREKLHAADGVFVTLSSFTEAARAEANTLGLELIDGRALGARVEKVRRPTPCPACARPMRLDKSLYGWWFRCTHPGCDGKRDLGPNLPRALELLTEAPGSDPPAA